jgi:hypothetical protein
LAHRRSPVLPTKSEPDLITGSAGAGDPYAKVWFLLVRQ